MNPRANNTPNKGGNMVCPLVTAALLFGLCQGMARADESFERIKVVLEQNVQDQDAEVKIEATGGKGGLSSLQVKAPDGRIVIDFKAPDSRLGMRTLLLESPEPKNDGHVQADFPAGAYTFSGLSAGGERLQGQALLSHVLPAPAAFIHPRPDATNVAHQRLRLNWRAVKGLASQVVVIEQEASGRALKASLPGNATSFNVPDGFLLPATPYKLAIGTVAPSGNSSFIETEFTTAKR